jgi:hypothetical protein
MYLGQSRVRVDRDIPKCAHGRERDLLKMPLIWRVDCTSHWRFASAILYVIKYSRIFVMHSGISLAGLVY